LPFLIRNVSSIHFSGIFCFCFSFAFSFRITGASCGPAEQQLAVGQNGAQHSPILEVRLMTELVLSSALSIQVLSCDLDDWSGRVPAKLQRGRVSQEHCGGIGQARTNGGDGGDLGVWSPSK
jgi:hypothetical protein